MLREVSPRALVHARRTMRVLACVGALSAVVLPTGVDAQAPWWAPRYSEPLEGSSVAERKQAAETLGREVFRPRVASATARLVRALEQERHPVVRESIIVALGRLAHPDALDALVAELASSRSREAQQILWAMGAIAEQGSPRAATVLVEQLTTRGRTDYAREALQRAGVVALPALLRALRDTTDGRSDIARAIGATRSHQATPSVVRALTGPWQPAEGTALLEALAEIADPRSRDAVLQVLATAVDGRVQHAALVALAALGVGAGADMVAPLLRSEDVGVVRQALATLLQLDPERGALALTAGVADSDPSVVQQAAELALTFRHPLVVPVLFGLVNEGSRAERALSALAELDDGAGVPVLLHIAHADPLHASAARTALALALRRFAEALPRRERREALAEVAREPGSRAGLLRALAGDLDAERALLDALTAPEALTRREAAHALLVLGTRAGRGVGPALVAAARSEVNAEIFEELAYAHVHTRASCPTNTHGIRARLRASATRDAALLLLSGCHEQLTTSLRAELAQTARQQLRSRSAPSRATAAWGLARLGDAEATRTLLSHLESEADPWVRRALARAIWVLATPEHAPDARNASRMERDARAAAWLREAGVGGGEERRFESRGEEVLQVQLRPVDPQPEGLVVEVRLNDGRALRATTFPDGLLLLPDLAAGTADVTVVPTPSLSPR